MINRVVLVGRLTRDPMVRKTNNGTSTVSFTLAVDRGNSKTAQPGQPTADFISCVAWRGTADLIAQYVHKGSQIGVDGRIQTRSYDDTAVPGRKVYVTEVVCDNITFLDTRNSGASQNQSYYPDNGYNGGYNSNNNGYNDMNDMADGPVLDVSSIDDLPF